MIARLERRARARPATSAGRPPHSGQTRRTCHNVRVTELNPDVAALLKRNPDGLVPAIVQDATDGRVLMLAWMDDEALQRTLTTGRATYWSRSRQEYWVKGETSGNPQHVHEVRLDCDGDTLLILVEAAGPACHTGAVSCFYRSLALPI